MKNLKLEKEDNYAIIEKSGEVLITKGEVHYLSNLSQLEKLQEETKRKIVFITPFCLAGVENGYEVLGNEKIIAMEVEEEILLTKSEILDILEDNNIEFGEIKTSISDHDFADVVCKAKEKIINGEFNQLVLSREFYTDINANSKNILGIFRKLLLNIGQYMTFLFNTPEKTFIGASPERHLTVEKNKATMNPIAGTFRKKDKKSFYDEFSEFLDDSKEISELAMVIDEELKMMSKITKGGNIESGLIKELLSVIHTEANLVGDLKNGVSILDALKMTLYAPTLVGGPIESAFKQISLFEKKSRGYYGASFGIYDKDFLDTAIVIRTAFIDKLNNLLTVRAGAGIVKDSVPENEVKETIAKSNVFFLNFKKSGSVDYDRYLDGLSNEESTQIEKLLQKRKDQLSKFYRLNHEKENLEVEEIKSKKILLINSGDDFVYLSGFMIEKMGGIAEVVSSENFDYSIVDNFDIILLGPGYGNINNTNDKRIINLLRITKKLIKEQKNILGICLGHQAICKLKGYDVCRQNLNFQGEQKKVNFGGKEETLGFYNSYSPVFNGSYRGNIEEIDTFYDDSRILNYRNKHIYSTQSHPESIMSINGFDILKNMILHVLKK
ncbi:chorismate-binding protein [Candidatus Gracilibacteria bacterium]|nr:chorismate-binding protein [Candidatus Gracilibacteria bacterium]